MAEQVLMHKKYYMPYQIGFLSDDDETFRIYFDKKIRPFQKEKADIKYHCMQKSCRRQDFHIIF